MLAHIHRYRSRETLNKTVTVNETVWFFFFTQGERTTQKHLWCDQRCQEDCRSRLENGQTGPQNSRPSKFNTHDIIIQCFNHVSLKESNTSETPRWITTVRNLSPSQIAVNESVIVQAPPRDCCKFNPHSPTLYFPGKLLFLKPSDNDRFTSFVKIIREHFQ